MNKLFYLQNELMSCQDYWCLLQNFLHPYSDSGHLIEVSSIDQSAQMIF